MYQNVQQYPSALAILCVPYGTKNPHRYSIRMNTMPLLTDGSQGSQVANLTLTWGIHEAKEQILALSRKLAAEKYELASGPTKLGVNWHFQLTFFKCLLELVEGEKGTSIKKKDIVSCLESARVICCANAGNSERSDENGVPFDPDNTRTYWTKPDQVRRWLSNQCREKAKYFAYCKSDKTDNDLFEVLKRLRPLH
jgi:hypothetical protein